jgi:LAO/AO transport system ATPase
MIDSLLERFRQGDRLALSRLVTLLARGQESECILNRLGQARKQGRIVAITGSGGVGKSTLVGKLIEHLRNRNQTVAVLACDPQSPVSGGALLGDRFRMPSRPDDNGVFIRSLAAAGEQGAVALHLPAIVQLLESFGFDVVLIETVGAGQGDTVVHDLADVVVLLIQPETGDDLQWEKAGVLEVADVVVIHKADLPGADTTEAQVRASLDLPGARPLRLFRVSAKKSEGIEQLWQTIESCPLRRMKAPAAGRELLRLAQETLASRYAGAVASHDKVLEKLINDWQQGRPGKGEAVEALIHHLLMTDNG